MPTDAITDRHEFHPACISAAPTCLCAPVHHEMTEGAVGVTLIDLPLTGHDSERDLGTTVLDDAAGIAPDEERVGTSFPRCADGNGTLTHLFFSDDEFDIARAKAICGRCGFAESCLAGALERREPCGVWGGKLVVDGVVVEIKRGRGRPPKHPRPPLVVDEVPVPPHLVA